MKKVLITGALGQNGKILSRIYTKKNFQVFGFVKKKHKYKIKNVKYLINNLQTKSKIKSDLKKIKPDIILHFASINNSFAKRIKKDNYKINYLYNIQITKNLIDSILKFKKKPKFIFAGSSVMFSSLNKPIISEKNYFNSSEYYGRYKIDAYKYIQSKENLNATTVILFNHDSIYRNKKFLIPRLIKAIKEKRISFIKKIYFENISGDFSHAEDICYGIYKISTMRKKIDKVILSSGKRFYLNHLIKFLLKKKNLKIKIDEKKIKNKKHNHKSIGSNIFLKKNIKYKPKKSLKDAALDMLQN